MERIILEVDDSVGKIFNNMSPKSKMQVNQAVSLMLKKAGNDAAFQEYSKILDDIGVEALKNGLTTEKLKELLASDD